MAATRPGEPVPTDFADPAPGTLAGLGVGALIARQMLRADVRQVTLTRTTLLERREPQPRPAPAGTPDDAPFFEPTITGARY